MVDLAKQTVPQIAELSGCSERQLYRWFDEYLENYRTWHIQRREKVNLLIDGTWFPNKMCLVLYRDETVRTTLFTDSLMKNGRTRYERTLRTYN